MNYRQITGVAVLTGIIGLYAYLRGYNEGYAEGESRGTKIGRVRQLINEGYPISEIPNRLQQEDRSHLEESNIYIE